MPPMSSAEIWQNLQEALNRDVVTDPLRNLTATNQTIALRNLAVRQSRESRAMELEQESELRMKEAKENERLRMINEFAKEGAPVTTDMTEDQANAARKQWMGTRAQNVLNTYKVQIQGAQEKQADAMANLQRIANSPKLGTKEQRQVALKAALEDPSARKLPDDVRANLWKVLKDKDDPAAAMDDAVKRMQSFWGSGTFNILPGTRYSQAAAFLNAYMTPLQATASDQHKEQMAIGMQQLQAATKEEQDLSHQAFTHIGANAAWLPSDSAASFSKSLGFTGATDPNSVMGKPGMTGAGAPPPGAAPPPPPGGGGQDQTPGSAAADTVPTPDAAPPGPRAVRPFGNMPGTAASPQPGPGVQPGAAATGGVMNPDIAGDLGNLAAQIGRGAGRFITGSPETAMQPGQIELLHFAAQRDLRMNPNPKPMPSTPAEQQKVQQLFRTWALSSGASPEDVDREIATANKKIAQGDPESIALANRMLLTVRKSSQGAMGAAVPGTAPAVGGGGTPPIPTEPGPGGGFTNQPPVTSGPIQYSSPGTQWLQEYQDQNP